MMKRIIAVLLLWALPVAASAAISVVQNNACTIGATTCSFSSAPANGDSVVISTSGAGNCSVVAIHDSNSVNLTSVVGIGSGNKVWAYIVSGSPTSTYTNGATCIDGMLELSSTSAVATWQTTSGSATSTYTTTALSSTVAAGGAMLCVDWALGSANGVTSSVGTLTSVIAVGSQYAGYNLPTSPQSSATCTGTTSGGTAEVGAVGMNGSSSTPSTYPGAGMVGDAMFEVFLADLSKAA